MAQVAPLTETASSLLALKALARRWAEADPAPAHADALLTAEALSDEATLRAAFDEPLRFGTAGLRGLVGAGPARMNDAVVLRLAAGLADVLTRSPDWQQLPVIIGFDGRTHARRFAELAAGVFAARRLPVRFFPEPTPTPLVAFAARELAAQAALMFTASHNPAAYEGVKVYSRGGAQLVAPLDAAIADAMAAVPSARAVRRVERAFDGVAGVESVPPSLVERHATAVLVDRPAGLRSPVCIAYSALHGVGQPFVLRLLGGAGLEVHVVEAQGTPNGAFPGLPFPNPEEPGTLDAVLALAAEREAALVLVNDPDADRLGVAVRAEDGTYRVLTGNEVGVLLLSDRLARRELVRKPVVLSTLVSTPLAAVIAEAAGVRFERTATGFKWLWSAAATLMEEGYTPLLCFEEALGYSLGTLVRDKDGVAAALHIADLAARLAADGRTLLDELERLYATHGRWVSVQRSVVRAEVGGLATLNDAVARLRRQPPTELGGRAVSRVVDHRALVDAPTHRRGVDLLELWVGEQTRVLLRPSGTEPKLKIYVDLCAEAPERSVDADGAVSPAAPAELAALTAAAREAALAVADAAVLALGLAR